MPLGHFGQNTANANTMPRAVACSSRKLLASHYISPQYDSRRSQLPLHIILITACMNSHTGKSISPVYFISSRGRVKMPPPRHQPFYCAPDDAARSMMTFTHGSAAAFHESANKPQVIITLPSRRRRPHFEQKVNTMLSWRLGLTRFCQCFIAQEAAFFRVSTASHHHSTKLSMKSRANAT